MKIKLFFVALFIILSAIETYSQDESFSIYNYRNGNEINSLAISDSFVFVGTSNGVYQRSFSGELVKTHNTEGGLLNNTSNLIFAENNEKIWISTPGILHLYDNSKYLMFDESAGIFNNTVFSMCAGSDGSIWIANFNGISQYKDQSWNSYTIPFVAPDTISFNSIIYNSDLLWGSTSANGLYSFNGANWTIYDSSNGMSWKNLVCMRRDDYDSLWIATPTNGLIEKNGGWNQHYDNILSGKVVNDFVIDKNNSKWLFTSSDVIKYSGGKWSILDSLASVSVKTGRIDTDNNLWLAAENMLIKYMPSTDSLIRFEIEGLLYNAITSIHVDHQNTKWIGNSFGISRYNNGWSNIPFNEINNSSDKTYHTFTSIQEDLDQNIWTSYYNPNGISSYDGHDWSLTPSNNLGLVIALAVDSTNNIWAGDNTYGVQYFDGNKWSDPISSNSLPSKDINCISVDNDNAVWIGTSKMILMFRIL